MIPPIEKKSTFVLQTAPFVIASAIAVQVPTEAAITSTARELPAMAAGTKTSPKDNGMALRAFDVQIRGEDEAGAAMLPGGHKGHIPEHAEDKRPARFPYVPSGQREHTAAPAREYVPGGQIAHETMPFWPQVPAGQATQPPEADPT